MDIRRITRSGKKISLKSFAWTLAHASIEFKIHLHLNLYEYDVVFDL
jgi:hypothetical protein